MSRNWISRLLPTPVTPAPTVVIPDTPEDTNDSGALYASGDSVPRDYARAVQFFRKAAEGGYAPAQNNLGMMFASGHGVLKSETEACRWFRRAAEQGDAGAQFNLGNLCHPASLGQLVRDAGEARIQAYTWFSLAAAQGHRPAAASCDMLNLQMSDFEIGEAKRRAAAFLPNREESRPEPR